jgi:hypothetical protein
LALLGSRISAFGALALGYPKISEVNIIAIEVK